MTADGRVIVVLGMHHGGTSVIARSLLVFNVYLGDDLLPFQPDHPTGFWEDNRITAGNDHILRALGYSWWKLGFDCARMQANSTYQRAVKLIAHDVRLRFGHVPLWGFKDPRTCRLIPLWKGVFRLLDVRASYIIVVRHPRSVAESLKLQYGMSLHLGYKLWLEHMVAAVRETRRNNRVFVSYDRMLDNPSHELRRQAVALRLDLSQIRSAASESFVRSFLDLKLRHSRYQRSDVFPSLVGKQMYLRAFALLDAMATDAMSQTAFNRAWRSLFKSGYSAEQGGKRP